MHLCTSTIPNPSSTRKGTSVRLSDRGLDLELTKEGRLLLLVLESTVAEGGGGVDELEVDLLEVGSRSVDLERFSEGDDPLSGTGDGTLEDDGVASEDTVVREAAHGGEALLSDVVRGGARLGVGTVDDSVDLVVSAGSVVVTVLTGSGDREHDLGRVPSTDTGDLSETSVRLSRQSGNTPSGRQRDFATIQHGHDSPLDDTLNTLTLGNGGNVDHLVLLEDGANSDLLLKVALGELDLVGNRSTVDLNLHEVGLLLRKTSLGVLGVGEDSDDGAVLLDSLELSGDRSARVVRVLLGVSGEGLLLGSVPVLVESSLELVREVLGPHGRERSQASGRLDVSDSSDNDNRWPGS